MDTARIGDGYFCFIPNWTRVKSIHAGTEHVDEVEVGHKRRVWGQCEERYEDGYILPETYNSYTRLLASLVGPSVEFFENPYHLELVPIRFSYSHVAEDEL